MKRVRAFCTHFLKNTNWPKLHKRNDCTIFLQVDVILNTTTSFPNLNGAIPSAICKQGGPSIQTECEQYHNMTNEGDIVVTNAGILNCKQLFHYVLPNWNPSLGTKVISNRERILGECIFISSLPGKVLVMLVDITRFAEQFNMHSQSQAL